ncbi:shikimate kinase [Oceanobacillus piezotolerans]|uniref:Shikimate kinase n=1 Tax=Oceanobacillus piezotolerans TaxID=2448030 RepID=A0A498D7E8_9BACI|nr:shikimate kinase [Oceanobacillus piezotolerans]RLL46615.1 shikimate kinase [Oceanobacillus piezotolerans]
MKDLALREKNIVLIGFMGVGKTTIGKEVAKRLYRDFLDIDEVIEKEYGMPTRQIFENFGEKEFRQKEKDTIVDLCHNQRLKVISVGGGAFLQEEIKEACLSKCIVFFLDLSWDAWQDRISSIIDSRPVLQGKNREDMRHLFDQRQPIYKDHHYKVTTDNLNVNEVADFIVDRLKTAWNKVDPNPEQQ